MVFLLVLLAASSNLIGSYAGNSMAAGVYGATVGCGEGRGEPNQFRARAMGGVQVAAGGGSWLSISARNLKADCARVDGRAVLAAMGEDNGTSLPSTLTAWPWPPSRG